MTSATHGGERQAIHMIGVRRKKYELEAQIRGINEKLRSPSIGAGTAETLNYALSDLVNQLEIHQSTVTVNLVKNKRPPARLVDEVDYELEESTGRLLPLAKGDLPRAYRDRQRAVYGAKVDQRHLDFEAVVEAAFTGGDTDGFDF